MSSKRGWERPFSESVIKGLTDWYRKFRNTCRFMLGNLHDFDPDVHSLDVVTLRGVAVEQFIDQQRADLGMIEGSIDKWKKTYNGALVGETLARRRGFKIGDTFKTSNVQNEVSGIFRSDEPQNQNVAYVHLKALQQATDKKFGIVTQFLAQPADGDIHRAIESIAVDPA